MGCRFSATSLLCSPLLLLSLPTQVQAQKTWIVDQTGGGHFKTLQAAANAASHGDTIYIRAGSFYRGFQTSKALTVRSAKRLAIFGAITVSKIPKGRVFSIKKLQLSGLILTNNAGGIHVEDIAFWRASPGTKLCSIRQCQLVTFTNCTSRLGSPFSTYSSVTQPPTVEIDRSNVTLTDCNMQGVSYYFNNFWLWKGSPAIAVSASKLRISGGTLVGGNGTSYTSSANKTTTWNAEPAIQLTGGSLMIDEADKARIAAGSINSGNSVQHAIIASGTKITIDPKVSLTSLNTTLHVKGGTLGRASLQSVLATGANSSGQVKTTRYGTAGSISILTLGSPSLPLATPYGELWLGLTPLFFLDPTLLPQSGEKDLSIPVPAKGLPNGLALTFQALEITGTKLHLSLPTTILIN